MSKRLLFHVACQNYCKLAKITNHFKAEFSGKTVVLFPSRYRIGGKPAHLIIMRNELQQITQFTMSPEGIKALGNLINYAAVKGLLK